jgi:hypothetical protein
MSIRRKIVAPVSYNHNIVGFSSAYEPQEEVVPLGRPLQRHEWTKTVTDRSNPGHEKTTIRMEEKRKDPDTLGHVISKFKDFFMGNKPRKVESLTNVNENYVTGTNMADVTAVAVKVRAYFVTDPAFLTTVNYLYNKYCHQLDKHGKRIEIKKISDDDKKQDYTRFLQPHLSLITEYIKASDMIRSDEHSMHHKHQHTNRKKHTDGAHHNSRGKHHNDGHHEKNTGKKKNHGHSENDIHIHLHK